MRCDWQWGKQCLGWLYRRYVRQAMPQRAPKTAKIWISCEHVPEAVTGHETRKKSKVKLTQSISHQLLKSKSVYDTSKPPSHLSRRRFRQSFPLPESQSIGPQKTILLAISCHWESKARVQKKKQSSIPTNAEFGRKCSETKKRKYAQN